MHATNYVLLEAGAAAAGDVETLTRALSAPFDVREVKFKPAVVSGNRALALAYIDARVIQDRLDDVLGVAGWRDEYEVLPDGSVICRLHLKLGDEWITKVDVGGPSEQPDEGDRRKAAFSDALKRAAVKFGIGRYLYRLPSQWCDYDAHKKQFTRMPTLPPTALPRPALPARPAPRELSAKATASLPTTGAELQRRLREHDARLAKRGLCAPGDLVKHVVAAGVQAGHSAELSEWTGPAIDLAVQQTRAFTERQQPKEVA